MRRLRVLQVTHDLHPGGLPRVVDTLCRTLDSKRFEVSVLCLRDTGPLAEALQEDLQIPVLRLHGDPTTVDRLSFLKVRRLLSAHPVDVVHTHNSGPFFDGTIGAALAGVRTVVHTEHGRAWGDTPWRWRVIEHLLSYYAYRVVTVSDDSARSLMHWEKIPRAKIVIIPNGIDGSRYDVVVDSGAKRRALGIPEDSLVVGYASRLETEKNLELLLNAFSRVTETESRAFLLVAGHGSERERLEELASELGVSARVRFLGVRLDIPELLKVFDLHVLPSRREGLPMILLESMAAGCATVATAVGGVPDVIEHGISGELVNSGDADALSEAMGRLLRDPNTRARYVRRARTIFDQHYEAQVMARRYELLYQRRAAELDVSFPAQG